MSSFKVLGTTDDVTECSVCGKRELRGTMVLQSQDGEILHCGMDCGSKLAGRSASRLSSEAATEDRRNREVAERARRDAQDRENRDTEKHMLYWLRGKYPQAESTRDPRDGFVKASGKSWFQLSKDYREAGQPRIPTGVSRAWFGERAG